MSRIAAALSDDFDDNLEPYRFVRYLDSQGAIDVLLAFDPRSGRRVVIKRVHRESFTGEDELSQWEQQARFKWAALLAAELNHPVIAKVYDLFTRGEVEHIVMEYVPGPTLRHLFGQGTLLPIAQALKLAQQLSTGLAYAHRSGAIHGSLSADKILLDLGGDAKIIDFGISGLSGLQSAAILNDTYLATAFYSFTPEHVAVDEVGHRSDLFSLGVVLYELFTGQPPFVAYNAISMFHAIVCERQVSPRVLAPHLSTDLSELIDQLLEKEPDLRPPDAESVSARLRKMVFVHDPSSL